MAALIVRWLAGLAFLLAGLLKARDAQQFALDVQNYQLTSWTVSIVIAFYLPWLEVAAGLALISRRLYLGALAASIAMTLLFLGAILSAWHRDLDINCGCFGSETNSTNYALHLGADALLLLALGFLSLVHWRAAIQTRGANA